MDGDARVETTGEGDPSREGRVRAFYVSGRTILGLLLPGAEGTRKGWSLEVPGIPPDAEVLHMGHDIQRNGLVVVVAHPSFDPKPEGEYPPETHLLCRPVLVAVEATPGGGSRQVIVKDFSQEGSLDD